MYVCASWRQGTRNITAKACPSLPPSLPPSLLTDKHRLSKGVRTISGSWKGGRSSSNFRRGNKCQHLPGCTRPARPEGGREGGKEGGREGGSQALKSLNVCRAARDWDGGREGGGEGGREGEARTFALDGAGTGDPGREEHAQL